jgi:hypothetical protein
MIYQVPRIVKLHTTQTEITETLNEMQHKQEIHKVSNKNQITIIKSTIKKADYTTKNSDNELCRI